MIANWMRDERGSAPFEFITAGVLLLIPLVYLVITVGQVQAASFAAEGAVRQASRVFVSAPTLTAARGQAALAISDALADVNLTPADVTSNISCAPNPTACLSPDSRVTARMTVNIALPLIPKIFNLDKYARVAVSAESTEVVPR